MGNILVFGELGVNSSSILPSGSIIEIELLLAVRMYSIGDFRSWWRVMNVLGSRKVCFDLNTGMMFI